MEQTWTKDDFTGLAHLEDLLDQKHRNSERYTRIADVTLACFAPDSLTRSKIGKKYRNGRKNYFEEKTSQRPYSPQSYATQESLREAIAICGAAYVLGYLSRDDIQHIIALPPFDIQGKHRLDDSDLAFLQAGIDCYKKQNPDCTVPDLVQTAPVRPDRLIARMKQNPLMTVLIVVLLVLAGTVLYLLSRPDDTLTGNEHRVEVRTFSDVPMVMVPAGCFMMGHPDGNPAKTTDQVHEVCIEYDFWMDRYEVTNERYGSPPQGDCDYRRDADGNVTDERAGGDEPDRARNCVTWYEARAYCESRAARLPTEAEWAYAARGPENRVYPWGDEFDPGRANVLYEAMHEFVAPVDTYERGVSWVGAYNLSGGLWEWTASLFADYPYDADDGRNDPDAEGNRVLRGGSWDNDETRATGYYRGSSDPDVRWNAFGFRCVRDAEE